MLRAGASERQKVPARFQHAQALGPYVHARHVVVPTLTHEGQPIWRVGHDAIDARIGHRPQYVKAIAVVKIEAPHASMSSMA